ncbi:hypothetical protein ACWEPC_52490, partial [Nonomuraea sp. NPDC004297]
MDTPAQDLAHMARAVELAGRGHGGTSPNPVVGCVVLDAAGRPAGEGFHAHAGGPHAEVAALAQAGERARGGTAYVTPMQAATRGDQETVAVPGAEVRVMATTVRPAG